MNTESTMNTAGIKLMPLLAVVAMTFSLAPAYAAEDDEQRSSLEEVVVTAQRREQSLQEVGVSVTAFTAEAIEDADIHDLEGIASRTPSLNFAPFSPGQNIVTLRGASSNDDGAGTDNSVALFLDGVYLGRSSNINFEMADLQRIEVLRGPQGTLYGKNTIGGAINVVTRKPSVEEAYGAVSLSIGTYDLRSFAGYYSTPVSDTWALKFSGSSRTRDGWVENVLNPNIDQKNQNTQVARFQALYQGSKTSVLLGMDLNFLDTNDMGRIPIAGGALEHPTRGYLAVTGETAPNRFVSANPIDDGFARRNGGGFNVHVTHNFGEEDTLDYIYAYRRSLADWEMDSAGAPLTVLTDNIHDKTQQTSSELRANFAREKWNTTVGLWLYNESTDRTESFDLYAGGTGKGSEGGEKSNAGLTGIDSYTQNNTTISVALFGQSEVQITRVFYMTFGLRYSWEAKEIDSLSVDDLPTGWVLCDPVPEDLSTCPFSFADDFDVVLRQGGALVAENTDPTRVLGDDERFRGSNDINFIINENFSATADSSWSAITPKLTFGFRFNERNHMYLDFATGFKSGGFAAAPTTLEHLNPLDPESATNFEWGYKYQDDHHRMNLALFYTLYSDLQIQQFGPATLPDGSRSAFGFFRTINASNATVFGAELEYKYQHSQYFFMDYTVAYNNSEYSDGRALHTGATFDGKQLLRVPELKFSVIFGGDAPTSGGHTFRWSLDIRWEDETLHDLSNDLAVSPAHALIDLRLAWLFPGNFELALWGRNLTDSDWIQHIYTIGPGTIAVYGDPLTAGATFRYRF